MNISDENRKFLIDNLPDAEQLMNATKGELLSALDWLLVVKGMDDDGFYNAFGIRGQAVYDDLYEFA